MLRRIALGLALLPVLAAAKGLATLDGITFYDEPGRLYLPVAEVARAFDWTSGKAGGQVVLNKRPLRKVRRLVDGKPLVAVRDLNFYGLKFGNGVLRKKAKPKQAVRVREGKKRVVINKKARLLTAWQGQRVVFRGRVSYGRAANQTPNGIFRIQAYRKQVHRSRLYNNFPLPYAVQVVGNIFIHGAKNVGPNVESHGCIRMPMKSAQWFYFWVDKGTPVSILGKWPKGAAGKA